MTVTLVEPPATVGRSNNGIPYRSRYGANYGPIMGKRCAACNMRFPLKCGQRCREHIYKGGKAF